MSATWKASQKPREAPTRTFLNGPDGVAPWAQGTPPGNGGAGMMPPTRAPWAK